MGTRQTIRKWREEWSSLRGRMGRPGLYYISDAQDWSTRQDGLAITGGMQQLRPGLTCDVRKQVKGLYYQVVHFGSTWALVKNIDRTHESNRCIATIFHGHEGMSAEFDEAIAQFPRLQERVDRFVTACSGMVGRLEGWGVPAEKIRVIPLGVDLKRFRPATTEERRERREAMGIPEGAICIGSFQKDSRGWGDGMEPKPQKGPDVFVDAVTRLSRRHPVHVLLTGPARGYMKAELEKAGIPFTHTYLPDFNDLPRMFDGLDLYLVTSREEGGPKALLECMAAGVPFVTTRVGMAPDIIRSGENGVMVEVEDTAGIAEEGSRILADDDHRRRLVEGGLRAVRAFDWLEIAKRYDAEVYSPFLGRAKDRSDDHGSKL